MVAGTNDPWQRIAELEVETLCATARWCYARGWAPATSGNFSVRVSDGVAAHHHYAFGAG